MRISADFERMLRGYGLTTARIFYHLPDHQVLLQEFLFQQYDLSPEFPKLHSFLDFWDGNIDGPVHSVEVVQFKLITPGDMRVVGSSFALN